MGANMVFILGHKIVVRLLPTRMTSIEAEDGYGTMAPHQVAMIGLDASAQLLV